MRVVVSRSDAAFAATAAGVIFSILERRFESQETVTVALAGGKTPLPVYRALARRELDWGRVEIFFGDERAVSPENPECNHRAVTRALGRASSRARVRRIRGELGAAAAAAAYSEVLSRRFAPQSPGFDLAVLGVGEDGHTASLFAPPLEVDPEGRLLQTFAQATRSPVAPRDRVSLTLKVFNAAAEVVFLATGGSKARVVSRVMRGDRQLPAAWVAPASGCLTWVLDRQAAAEVEKITEKNDPSASAGR